MLVFFLFIVTVLSKNQDNCIWDDHRGYQYDISPLRKSSNYQVPDTDTSMGMFNMVYEFNFCTMGVQCQGREVAAYEALEVLGKLTENCDALGLRETQSISYINPSYPAQGIAVSYTQGDMCFDVKEDQGLQKLMTQDQQMAMSPRSVTFEISCAAQDDDNFHVIDSSKCNIRLGINHHVGCRGSTTSSDYSVPLLKLIMVVGALYMIGGSIYNQKTKRLHGIEAIPNIDFWRQCPGLVKDGINFSLISIIGKVKQYSGGSAQSSDRGYATV